MKKGVVVRWITIGIVMVAGSAQVGAQEKLDVTMYLVSAGGIGAEIGVIRVEKTPYGTLLKPDLENLPPGQHGFHVHQNPDCGPGQENGEMKVGLAAGGHLDPHNTSKHAGPADENGHLGDLPVLTVDAQGKATEPVLAPRITVDEIKGHALVIHAGSDTYSDQPESGGGGARIACGMAAG